MDNDTLARLEARVRFLTRYAAVSTVAFVLLGAGAFASARRARFTDIEAQRITIVEPDGRRVMVIANEALLPGVITDGREVTDRTGAAGMIFFNHKGDENGALIFGTSETDSSYDAGANFSFDQYNNDQVVWVTYQDNERYGRVAGLVVADRPEVFPARSGIRAARDSAEARQPVAQRVFVGSYDRTAMVRLKDTRGRTRLRMVVDSLDVPRIEFMDTAGTVVRRIPEN